MLLLFVVNGCHEKAQHRNIVFIGCVYQCIVCYESEAVHAKFSQAANVRLLYSRFKECVLSSNFP